MRHYEVTFIVDPVLSNDDIEGTSKNYVEHLQQDCEIVHVDKMGLRQLAYPINKRTSGVYYCIEFKTESDEVIQSVELALRRDERIIRFLTVKLDKYGVKYNDDKRNGRIGRKRKEEAVTAEISAEKASAKAASGNGKAEKAAPVAAAVAEEEE